MRAPSGAWQTSMGNRVRYVEHNQHHHADSSAARFTGAVAPAHQANAGSGAVRRLRGRAFVILIGFAIALLSSGCLSRPLLSPLQLSTSQISPNGDGIADEVQIDYTIGTFAEVSADLIGPDGTQYILREPRSRAPDDYRVNFNGAIALPDSVERRVLPEGKYTVVVRAKSQDGTTTAEERASLEIVNPDVEPVVIRDFTIDREEISPNGDARDDEVHFSYGLSKPATTTVYAMDAQGNYFLIEPPKEKEATSSGHIWDGKSGGRVLEDGEYTLYVDAEDKAGNFTRVSAPIRLANGGVPRLEIVEARFSPVAISLGGTVNVRITVRNTGTVPIRTMGPPPSAEYTTEMNFASFRDPENPNVPLYFERPGVFRVGVMWTNAPQNYPVRWGLFEDLDRTLMPGEEATINGSITVLQEENSRELTFWASVVQEGVGFPGGQIGHQRITLGF